MKHRLSFLCISALYLPVSLLWAGTTRIAKEVAIANNQFAVDCYAQLSKKPGNQVVSPISINTSFAMSYAGAKGETASQMRQVFHFPNSASAVHTGYGALSKNLNERSTADFKIVIANAMYSQKGYPILKPFQEILRDKYSTSLNLIDMTGWPNNFNQDKASAARKQINGWVADYTQNKITEILPPSLPNADTRLILVNAIWVKGKWAAPFSKALTTDARFYLDANTSVSVPTMYLTAGLRYTESDMLQVLELPYVSKQFAMVVFLPKKSCKLEEFEQALTLDRIEELRSQFKNKQVVVSFPKFKVQSEFDLKSSLQEMGVKDAFGMEADFSGITTRKTFFIDAAIHKSWLEVDEEGTEAAAATSLIVGEKSSSSKNVVFNADHPFLFLIRDNQTGCIVFMGRVADPSKQ